MSEIIERTTTVIVGKKWYNFVCYSSLVQAFILTGICIVFAIRNMPPPEEMADRMLHRTKMEVIKDSKSGAIWGLRISGYNNDDGKVEEELYAKMVQEKVLPQFMHASVFLQYPRHTKCIRVMYFLNPLPEKCLPTATTVIVTPLQLWNFTPDEKKILEVVQIDPKDSLKGYKLIKIP